MQQSTTLPRTFAASGDENVQENPQKKEVDGNSIILVGIAIFCCLLLWLDFPFWPIFIFASGMCFVLFLLYVISGFSIELDLDEKELKNGIELDLFY